MEIACQQPPCGYQFGKRRYNILITTVQYELRKFIIYNKMAQPLIWKIEDNRYT